MLIGVEMLDIRDMARNGQSISEISRITGNDRKTIRKYLLKKELPAYGPRPA